MNDNYLKNLYNRDSELSEINGEPVIWEHIAKKTFMGKPIIVLVITGKSAMILEIKDTQRNVLQQCSLRDTTVSVLNRSEVTNLHRARMGEQSTSSHDVGDILFFGNGQLRLRFDSIPNPDSVIEILGANAKQETAVPVVETTSSKETDVLVGEATRPKGSVEEVELWSYGPLVARVEFVQEHGKHSRREFMHVKDAVKIRYVLTNTRAYIIGASGEGKIEYFNSNAYFYKTFYHIPQTQMKIIKKKLMIAKGWNGGVIVQCYLADAQTAITNRNESATNGIEKPLGDINFLVGGSTALTFELVEDPDGVLSLINHLLKQRI